MAKKDQAKTTKKRTRPAPAPRPETIEEHMRRLGCFSPGEVAALLKVDVSHEHLDQLGRDKGVGIELPAQAEAEAQAIIESEPSRGEDVSKNEGEEGQGKAYRVETPGAPSNGTGGETPLPVNVEGGVVLRGTPFCKESQFPALEMAF